MAQLADVARLLLGSFPALGLFGQRLRQPVGLLLHFDLRCLQFLRPGFQPGLFGPFPTLGPLGQCFRQPLGLLLHIRLRRPQGLRLRSELGPIGKIILLLRVQ